MFDLEGSLGEAIQAGRRPALLVFSGQDPEWALHLVRCLQRFPGVRGWAEEVLVELGSRVAADAAALPALANLGLDPGDWLEAPEETFSDVATRLGVPLPAGQHVRAPHGGPARSPRPACSPTPRASRPCSDTSAGLFSAWVVARHGTLVPCGAATDALHAVALIGERLERLPEALPPTELDPLRRAADGPAVMLAVSGATERRLQQLIGQRPGSVSIALQNSWDRFVCSGATADLGAFAERLEEGGLGVEVVPSSVPFHHQLLAPSVAPTVAELTSRGLDFAGALSMPLIDPRDATVHRSGELVSVLVESMLSRPVRWADTLATLAGAGHVVLDVGPSNLAGSMCRRALRGSGATVVSLGTDEGLAELSGAGRSPEPLAEWSVHRPQLGAATSLGEPSGAGHLVRTRAHPTHAPISVRPAGHEPHHGRRRDRGSGVEGRSRGRAGRRRSGERNDLLGADRRAGRVAPRRSRGLLQRPAPRPVPVGPPRRSRPDGAAGPHGGCPDLRGDGVGGDPRDRHGGRAARGAPRSRHLAQRLQARHDRPGRGGSRDHPAASSSTCGSTWRVAGPAVTTRGSSSRTCCSPPTPTSGVTPTWCSAWAAASATLSGPQSCSGAPGRFRTAPTGCRWTGCCWAPWPWRLPSPPRRRR